MSRIFNLSLHRTGTQSLHDLFRRAGLRSVHWPAKLRCVDYQSRVEGFEIDLDRVTEVLDPVFQDADAVGDVPVPALYRQLSARFPEARFLAMVRPAREWVASVRRHVGHRPFDPFEKVVYWSHFADRPEALSDLSDDALADFFEAHLARLERFFAGTGRFRAFSLGPAVGEAICAYCGLDELPLERKDYLMDRETGPGEQG